MSRKKAMDIYKRQLEVKKLYLKGIDVTDIALQMGVTEAVVRTDLKRISEMYMKAVQDNPNIVEKTQEHILKHLDELKMVKQKLWQLSETGSTEKAQIAALKGILEELGHEARVLKLIDVSKTINNYIHVEKLAVLVNQVVEVIKEFVPTEKQRYALDRLKNVGHDNIYGGVS